MSRKSPLADNRIRDRFDDTIPANDLTCFVFIIYLPFFIVKPKPATQLYRLSSLPTSVSSVAFAAASFTVESLKLGDTFWPGA